MQFSGKEVFFDRDDLIVSKTDPQGRLTYVNHTFLDIAEYSEEECVGQQHNMIRNPNMPRAIFELLWKTIASGEEIFAYVVNATKSGGHYWVIAHVTPSIVNGQIVGYHSTRRVPNGETIRTTIMPLYDRLQSVEKSNSLKKDALAASVGALNDMLREKGVTYNEFISNLMKSD
ncbi:PAS domain-containing protein [Nisaea sp.]|uniref:PAS domain-containing protein n=1 Tax=Nisaea sp. TaxID=2024842 RepID=UPI002B27BC06|nr:PAS domain-containing protein [Nisaea sp.]